MRSAVITLVSLVTIAQVSFADLPEGWSSTGNWNQGEDGVISLVPREGETGWKCYDAYLWKDGEYENFEATFEYKHEAKGNSGFYFRIGDKADPVKEGIEVQILDSYGKKEPLGPHDCAGVIKTIGASANACKPAGEWNQMKVTVKDGQLTVVFNGQQVVDIDLSTSAVKDRPAKGMIAFQDHGQKFWLRNVVIKELK